MIYRTHISFSLSVAFLPSLIVPEYYTNERIPLIMGVVAFFSLFPDLDEPRSYLSRYLFFLSWIIASFTTHRGLTHQFISPLILSCIAFIFTPVEYYYLVVFGAAGYILHILGDAMTISGVRKAFYPLRAGGTLHILPKFLRFKTGSIIEEFWSIGFSILLSLEVYALILKNSQ